MMRELMEVSLGSNCDLTPSVEYQRHARVQNAGTAA